MSREARFNVEALSATSNVNLMANNQRRCRSATNLKGGGSRSTRKVAEAVQVDGRRGREDRA